MDLFTIIDRFLKIFFIIWVIFIAFDIALSIVKQSKTRSNVWYNTGHGHLGWTLSAYTAQTIVEKIRGYNGPFYSYR